MTEPRRMDEEMANMVIVNLIRAAGLTPTACNACGKPWPKEHLRQYGLCKRCDDDLARDMEAQVDADLLKKKEEEDV